MAAHTMSPPGRSMEIAPPPRKISRLARAAPYLLAVFFALWALRGVWSGNIVDTDAARHFMNGAFVHDLLRSGQAAHPVAYGKEYYGRLPALSMPYHPPLFPAIEGAFFLLFGVNLLTARMVVALAVGLSAILLYRLVRAAHGSDALAACVVATTFSLWHMQMVGTDVMLEYPSLVFVLLALHSARRLDEGYPPGRALWFALCGAAAVWTKQFAVFLVAVPPLYALATGHRRLLLRAPLWISSALFAVSLKALIALSAPFNHTGMTWVPSRRQDVQEVVFGNLEYYFRTTLKDSTGWTAVFAVGVLALSAWLVYKGAWRKLGLTFYLVWLAAAVAMLIAVGAHSDRYFFYLFPAVVTICYVPLFRASELLFGAALAWRLPAACAAVWLIVGLFSQLEYLTGPAEAAEAVLRGTRATVLYCGDADGNFIAAVRQRDPQFNTSVIPGEKLPPSTFEPAAFAAFCRRYSVEWVVLENSPSIRSRRWADLRGTAVPSMRLERVIRLDSSRPRWRGDIQVYRVADSSGASEHLQLPVPKIGGTVTTKPQ